MWPNPQETADLVTFTEEILNGKLCFLYSKKVWSLGIVGKKETEIHIAKYMKIGILSGQ